MPIHQFECKKCKKNFEVLTTTMKAFNEGFPDVRCEHCNSKQVKSVIGFRHVEAMFGNPRESSKWDNWSYRQGTTATEAKDLRRRAEAASVDKMPYRPIDDTNNGRRMNFID